MFDLRTSPFEISILNVEVGFYEFKPRAGNTAKKGKNVTIKLLNSLQNYQIKKVVWVKNKATISNLHTAVLTVLSVPVPKTVLRSPP